jgi:EAL domain-containing protein (putative c-di-GMP-specific phosphodiesterase class I)/GGDEF domain-containing protein
MTIELDESAVSQALPHPEGIHGTGATTDTLGASRQEHLCLASPTQESVEPPPWIIQENLREFFQLFHQQQLYGVFQPILDLRNQRYLGYEGLIRGPADSPLHTPKELFGLAHASGMSVEFERLCRETVLRDFAARSLAGRLFLNVSVNSLADPCFLNGATMQLLQELRLRPGQIVIEITESQKVSNFAALRDVLAHYRNQGFQIAIDDLGEGFSNLSMWSEIHPDYVKIDQHLIRNIAADPLKFRLVQAMRDIAESSHAELIAEGIETESEFVTIRDLGISHGQGFLICRPTQYPLAAPCVAMRRLINQPHQIVFPGQTGYSGTSVRQIVHTIEPLLPTALNHQVFDRFESAPELIALPVVETDGTPIGLINRYSLINSFARPFHREIFGKRPCTLYMNCAPIMVDHALSVQELALLVGRAEPHQLIDGFIITENSRYLGVGSTQSLMGLITEIQIRSARYANPLTQLPGNVPINEHIDRLLINEAGFVACYCDLDHFKPLNDCYGYRTGDQIIQLLATLLTRHCDTRQDFVGHIGGDDFILLMQSANWDERCRSILAAFDKASVAYLTPEHLQQGGYFAENRSGERVFHALPSLSIGALVVKPHHFENHREVSVALSAAKKEAKKIPGSSLFIERRRLP